MLKWITIDKNYTDYLRENCESRIPNTEYGSDKLKPFFGILFEVGDLVYVTQVSSYKPRHSYIKNDIDFIKVLHKGKGICVINLNYMFPVPKRYVSVLKYKYIDNYLTFKSENDKGNYIALLKMELSEINKLNISAKAQRLYNYVIHNPYKKVSERCFNYKLLEKYAQSYSDSQS